MGERREKEKRQRQRDRDLPPQKKWQKVSPKNQLLISPILFIAFHFYFSDFCHDFNIFHLLILELGCSCFSKTIVNH